jgi:hypothetical protein
MALSDRALSVAYRAAWLAIRHIPEPVARWLFSRIAD